MKFLKRGKKESSDELDLPPAPPPLEGFEEGLQDMPELPPFDEKISAPKDSSFDFPEDKIPGFGKEEFPDFPDFPEPEEKFTAPVSEQVPQAEPIAAMPQLPEPEPVAPMPEQEEPEEKTSFMPEPKIERRLFSHEKRARETPKTIYVKVDNFKATLGNISMARGNLRKSEEALAKMESIKSAKDKSFDKIRTSLDDLQKKLVYVDKILFKGD
ncbi:hypothetical protein HYT53_05555 [Candidatus Woesearchaeota archaeon]|nr:hypothetical protein [Candidatus Woesearchaeota archaeon]